MSHVMCPVSPVTCLLCKQPQPQTLPLLILLQCTVGCFANTQKTYFFSSANNYWRAMKKIFFPYIPILAILPLTIGLQSTRKWGFHTLKHTHTHTHNWWTSQHRDWIGLGGWWSENDSHNLTSRIIAWFKCMWIYEICIEFLYLVPLLHCHYCENNN